MARTWNRETPARWDADKASILGTSPEGVFDTHWAAGDLIPGDWWRVEEDGRTVGYGWLDVTWGYAPVLLAVAPDMRGRGVGSWILDKLSDEAHSRGLAYMFNQIPAAHPQPDQLGAWLRARGFEPSQSDGMLLRRRVPSK